MAVKEIGWGNPTYNISDFVAVIQPIVFRNEVRVLCVPSKDVGSTFPCSIFHFLASYILISATVVSDFVAQASPEIFINKGKLLF